MRTRHVLAAAAAFALAGGTAGAALTASAAAPARKAGPTVSVVAKKLAGPLSVAQAPDGTRYWTDDFTGTLYKQSPGGQPTVAYKGTKKTPAEAVSADGGVLRFSVSSTDEKAGTIWTLGPTGAPVKLADVYAYEKSANPDGKIKYGFQNTPKSCLAQVPSRIPAVYKGPKETHPYATAVANGITYVADAGGNTVLAVSPTGQVSTAAVIKPLKVKVTKNVAGSLGLPSCTIGKKYAFESVPTDVEVGPGGLLYVTSLPGGPQDPSLGANGRVVRVDPTTGHTKTIVRGLLTPTGLAVASNGDIYVADLFTNQIVKIKAGSSKVRRYLDISEPAAVEVTPTGLLATINALSGNKPKGQVVTITP